MEMHVQVEELMREGRLAEAADTARSLLIDHPTNARLNADLGFCEFHQGRYQEALSPLERAVALDPRFVAAGVKLAQTYDRLHRYHECAVVAKQMLVTDPGNHTLQGLLEFHGDDLSLDQEGWEKHKLLPKDRRGLTNR